VSRPERLAKIIKQEVSEIIHEQVSDPRIGFISVTDVDLSPDLENCRIFISVLGNEQSKQDSMQGLESATRFIRGKLGDRVEFREVPKIAFVRDDSLEKGSKVLGIINKLEPDKDVVEKEDERDIRKD
jgi:ribosome-binding factor A